METNLMNGYILIALYLFMMGFLAIHISDKPSNWTDGFVAFTTVAILLWPITLTVVAIAELKRLLHA